MIMQRFVLSLCLVLCEGSFLYGGGFEVHAITGKIAYQHLTPKAKEKVDQLLQAGREALMREVESAKPETRAKLEKLEDFQLACIWADLYRTRPEGKYSSTFHYINLPLSTEKIEKHATRDEFLLDSIDGTKSLLEIMSKRKDLFQTGSDDDLVSMKLLLSSFQQPSHRGHVSPEEYAKVLFFFVHMVGDLNSNPLHVASSDDKGGNTIQVRLEKENGKTIGTNLHAAWDQGILEENLGDFTNIEKAVMQFDTEENRKLWMQGSVEDWALEQVVLSRQIHKHPETNAEIKNGDLLVRTRYQSRYLLVNEELVCKAGLRIAYLLNDIFDK